MPKGGDLSVSRLCVQEDGFKHIVPRLYHCVVLAFSDAFQPFFPSPAVLLSFSIPDSINLQSVR